MDFAYAKMQDTAGVIITSGRGFKSRCIHNQGNKQQRMEDDYNIVVHFQCTELGEENLAPIGQQRLRYIG